jgi:hypothetical protein
MAEQCFRKKDSNPPVCGVHTVVLQRNRVLIDSHAPQLGHVTCDLCPISRSVVREPRQVPARNSFASRYLIPA